MGSRFLIIVLVLIAFVSCQSTPSKNQTAESKTEDSDLSQVAAQNRKKRIENIQYKMNVTLNATDTFFKGHSDISFDLKDKSESLRIDFYEGSVQAIELNGQPLNINVKKKYWIELPSEALKVGTNVLKIDYTHDYATDGQGLHRFVDPETKDVFLYSQFETFDANRFMPCFDQPDLKATYQIQVTAPKKWAVISTAAESKITALGENRVWDFPATDKLSTYVFSLHAGPYKVWTDNFQGMRLRLFARPTMAPFVKVNEWFKITKQGLRFYNSYYKLPYPFKKYDQLIVPEFNAGAMENVGAVTFTEFMLTRADQPTRSQRRRVASVILHEMAHMWFGDAVTMVWWNDLWLNESFATYMQQLSMKEATEFQESWLEFFAGTKQWAYWQDRLVTSHPIEGEVPSVKTAFGTFDGITYGKGGSVLKQLKAYIGEKAFRDGIADYIREHAYGNATRADFISSLQKHTSHDLGVWSERWLKQSHTDEVAAHWTCKQGKLNQIQIEIKPFAGTQFRPQTLQVGLFSDVNGSSKLMKSIPVTMTSPVETIKGSWSCPSLVYPNFQDDGFVSVQLDAASLKYTKEHLSQVSDDLLRSQLWWSLWEMVQTSRLPLKEYIQTWNKNFASEKNEILLHQILGTIRYALFYWPETEKEKGAKLAFIKDLENDYMKRLMKAAPGSDDQKIWFDSYVAVARNPQALTQLGQWMHSGKVAKGFSFDLDRQWTVIQKMMEYDTVESQKVLADMIKKDSTDKGRKQALSAMASQPRAEVKKKFVEAIKPFKGEYSFQDIRFISGALFPDEQHELAKVYEDDFYDYLNQYGNSEDENHVESVASALAPLHCDPTSSQKLKNYVNTTAKLSPSLRKSFNTDIDNDERCQSIRKLSF